MSKPVFRVIIAGGRDFSDYNYLKDRADTVLIDKAKTHKIEIVSGMAKGADTLAIKYAREKGYGLIEMPADWDRLGKRAGFVRNQTMADESHALIAFHDTVSRGTRNMIDIMIKAKKPYRVYTY